MSFTGPVRRLVALLRARVRLVLVAGLVGSLTACAALPFGAGAGTGTSTRPGVSDLAAVRVGDGNGTPKPTLTVPTPFTVVTSIKKVLITGDGPALALGMRVTIDYVALNGTDGKEIDSSYGRRPTSFILDYPNNLKGLVDGLTGATVGSRVLLAISPTDGYGVAGMPPKVGPSDTIVTVVDIRSAQTVLKRATGKAVAPKDGLPTVKLDANGKPTITLPDTTPPASLVVQPLIQGAGAKVTKGQQLTVQYTGVTWPGGKVFDSSWAAKTPASFAIGVGKVIAGWDVGLVGQTIGSQVLLIVPPDQAYGADGKPEAGIKGTDTLVFVVDILDAA